MTEEKYPALSSTPGPVKASEHRKSTKPIMEKRRRARINQSLGELKSLILDAMKKDSSRHSKLEKADILELTVKHLQSLQRQQMAVAVNQDPSVLSKYRAGYNHCATEVARYLTSVDGLDTNVSTQLISHLSSNMRALDAQVQYNTTVGAVSPVQVHVPNGVPTVNFTPQIPYTVNVVPKVQYTSDNNGTPQFYSSVGVQLIPSTLPTGEIAFVLPSPQLNSTTIPIRQNTQRQESNEILPPSPASLSFLSPSPSSSSSSPPSTSSSSSSPPFLFSGSTSTTVTPTNNLSPSSSGASLPVCSSVCSPSKLETVSTKQSHCHLVNVKREDMWRPW